MATLSLTRNRYATYAVCLAALIFTGYRQVIGKINWVGNWPLLGAVRVERHQRARVRPLGALAEPGLRRSAWRSCFTALTARFYARRDLDAVRPGPPAPARPAVPVRRSGSCRSPSCRSSPGRSSGSKVDHGFQGEADQEARERLLAQEPGDLPRLAAARHHGRRPRRRRSTPRAGGSRSPGTYDLVNNQDKPLRQIPRHRRAALGVARAGRSTARTSRPTTARGSTSSRLPTPLAPGGTARLGFAFEGAFPAGITQEGRRHDGVHPPLGRGPHQLRPELRAGARVLRAGRGRRGEQVRVEGIPRRLLRGPDRVVRSAAGCRSRRGSRSPARPTSRSTRSARHERRRSRTGAARPSGRATTRSTSSTSSPAAGQVRRGEGTAVYYHPSAPLQRRRDGRGARRRPEVLLASGSAPTPGAS